MRIQHLLIPLVLTISFFSCIETNQSFTKLPPGLWRGVLKLEAGTNVVAVEEEIGTAVQNDNDLPFQFNVIYDDPTTFYIEIMNGEERIAVSDIIYGLDRKTAKDTLIINFPVFDTYIKALYEESIIEGDWFVNYKPGYSIPFKAYHARGNRFKDLQKVPTADLTGKWETTFEPNQEDEYPAIGLFEQEGNKITGTFETETGDYRYLEGTVQGNKLYMSTFDGAHAFLFTGKIMEDGNLVGEFRSGNHYKSSWIAKRNADFELKDPFEMTSDLTGEPLNFTFPSTDGSMVSLTDDAFKGKIKLVKIMGTWCPNCKDETKFLLDYLKNNNPKDIEVIAIGFERYKDEAKSMAALKRYKDKWEVPYQVLLGGTSASKSKASEKIPQLSGILSYPTLIFVDKSNKIRKIYTGFSGPATDQYQDFLNDFDRIIEELRKEKI